MKYFALLLLAVSSVYATDNCYNNVNADCSVSSSSVVLPSCNSIFGGYGHHGNLATELQAYANLHIARSFEYLQSSAYFNGYQTNRVGFSKLFKKLSDETWGKGIDIIKHITTRGGVMDFARRSTQEPTANSNFTSELHELHSLARALDTQKEIAERAFHIHREAVRNTATLHDAEIAQYLEEDFVEHQTKTIRQLAGYTSDLKKFITQDKGGDLSLSMYLFDEYLQKTV